MSDEIIPQAPHLTPQQEAAIPGLMNAVKEVRFEKGTPSGTASSLTLIFNPEKLTEEQRQYPAKLEPAAYALLEKVGEITPALGPSWGRGPKADEYSVSVVIPHHNHTAQLEELCRELRGGSIGKSR